MWICLNNAFFSIVENNNVKYDVESDLLVRARRKGDLEQVFLLSEDEVLESEDSDYRFRAFLSRDKVAEVMAAEVYNIDYSNFKNSVDDDELHDAYGRIWTIMYSLQERLYPRASGWWLNYRR